MQQLEHQVKELENIIKKRFPNSLSALILSSGVAEGQTKARYMLASYPGVRRGETVCTRRSLSPPPPNAWV